LTLAVVLGAGLDLHTTYYNSSMTAPHKRATVYLDPEIPQALRAKSVATERSISEIVNEAVRHELAEDAEDFAAFEDTVGEPLLDFEEVVEDLKRRGRI
jgi:predicted DNA-binding protein